MQTWELALKLLMDNWCFRSFPPPTEAILVVHASEGRVLLSASLPQLQPGKQMQAKEEDPRGL